MTLFTNFFTPAPLPSFPAFWAAVLFVFGICIGSFLNACIYRMPHGISLANPKRSICFFCKTPIAWFDNLPLISYVLLGGRCRHCGVGFSMRYFFVELMTGLLYVAGLFLFGTDLVALLVWLYLVSVLTVIFWIDVDHQIIPDELSLSGIPIGIALALLVQFVPLQSSRLPVQNAGEAIIGIVVGYGILALVRWAGTIAFRKEAMGMGDLKLLAMMGGFLGWEATLYTVVLSAFLGSVFGIAGKLYGGLRAKQLHYVPLTEIPYGPYLAVAGLFCFAFAGPLHHLMLAYLGYY